MFVAWTLCIIGAVAFAIGLAIAAFNRRGNIGLEREHNVTWANNVAASTLILALGTLFFLAGLATAAVQQIVK
jgi:uncharacterized membrane protein YiaA